MDERCLGEQNVAGQGKNWEETRVRRKINPGWEKNGIGGCGATDVLLPFLALICFPVNTGTCTSYITWGREDLC